MPFLARCIHQRQPRYAVGTAATTAVTGPTATPSATVATAAVPTAYLGWRWWTHRAKNGIKF